MKNALKSARVNRWIATCFTILLLMAGCKRDLNPTEKVVYESIGKLPDYSLVSENRSDGNATWTFSTTADRRLLQKVILDATNEPGSSLIPGESAGIDGGFAVRGRTRVAVYLEPHASGNIVTVICFR